MSFAERCGLDSPLRQARCAQVLRQIEATGIEQIRLSWCDQHGQLRGKTLTPRAVKKALHDGIGMVSTILLKDTSDRTVYKIFEEGGVVDLPGSKPPATWCCCPILAVFGNSHGRTTLPGCNARPGSRTANQCCWTRGGSCKTRCKPCSRPVLRCNVAWKSNSIFTR